MLAAPKSWLKQDTAGLGYAVTPQQSVTLSSSYRTPCYGTTAQHPSYAPPYGAAIGRHVTEQQHNIPAWRHDTVQL